MIARVASAARQNSAYRHLYEGRLRKRGRPSPFPYRAGYIANERRRRSLVCGSPRPKHGRADRAEAKIEKKRRRLPALKRARALPKTKAPFSLRMSQMIMECRGLRECH